MTYIQTMKWVIIILNGKGWEKEFGERIETMETTALLQLIRILRKILETWGDVQSYFIEKPYV